MKYAHKYAFYCEYQEQFFVTYENLVDATIGFIKILNTGKPVGDFKIRYSHGDDPKTVVAEKLLLRQDDGEWKSLDLAFTEDALLDAVEWRNNLLHSGAFGGIGYLHIHQVPIVMDIVGVSCADGSGDLYPTLTRTNDKSKQDAT